jgi:hypothetical protein
MPQKLHRKRCTVGTAFANATIMQVLLYNWEEKNSSGSAEHILMLGRAGSAPCTVGSSNPAASKHSLLSSKQDQWYEHDVYTGQNVGHPSSSAN